MALWLDCDVSIGFLARPVRMALGDSVSQRALRCKPVEQVFFTVRRGSSVGSDLFPPCRRMRRIIPYKLSAYQFQSPIPSFAISNFALDLHSLRSDSSWTLWCYMAPSTNLPRQAHLPLPLTDSTHNTCHYQSHAYAVPFHQPSLIGRETGILIL